MSPKNPAGCSLATYKIVILGPGGVGKSAITSQFVRSFFTQEYDPTIEDSYTKNCIIDDISVRLDILDTAGQEQFTSMREQYMKNGDGFLLVFSLTDIFTFNEMNGFYQQISMVKNSFPMILIGNKCDLEQVVNAAEIKKFTQSHSVEYMEVSAKENLNVEQAFFQLVRNIRKFKQVHDPKPKPFRCLIL